MKVEIWSDVACPWCYVGKRRFERALSSFPHRNEVEIVWRSFELNPDGPRTQPGSVAEMLARKYGMPVERARAMNANMATEGAKEGIEFHFEHLQLGNTFDAHRLIHLAASVGKREAMVERLFRAYFTDGKQLGDVDTLITLAAEVGIDAERARSMLSGSEFQDAVRADEHRARMFGITGVPFFAIDEKYGISGAQQPDALLAALTEAWESAEVSA